MWIPKWQRDLTEGIDSPVPTHVVSNEEFIPRPQNKHQMRLVEVSGHRPTRPYESASGLARDIERHLADEAGSKYDFTVSFDVAVLGMRVAPLMAQVG